MAAATALTIASIAASTGGAALSFRQALKANNLQKQAQRDAENAMQQARKTLGVNYLAGLSIQKEGYELERDALLAQGAQAIQAGVESERGSAATAGRIQFAQNEAQAGQRVAMGQELANLEKLKAQEDARIATTLGNLSLMEAQGQQQIAADAAKEKAAAIQSGMASATSAIQQGIQAVPLFSKGKGVSDAASAVTSKIATPNTTMADQGQVPSSKLNISSFQQMPSTNQILDNNLQTNMQYGMGSKLGSAMLIPSWEDAANYFKFYK